MSETPKLGFHSSRAKGKRQNNFKDLSGTKGRMNKTHSISFEDADFYSVGK